MGERWFGFAGQGDFAKFSMTGGFWADPPCTPLNILLILIYSLYFNKEILSEI